MKIWEYEIITKIRKAVIDNNKSILSTIDNSHSVEFRLSEERYFRIYYPKETGIENDILIHYSLESPSNRYTINYFRYLFETHCVFDGYNKKDTLLCRVDEAIKEFYGGFRDIKAG